MNVQYNTQINTQYGNQYNINDVNIYYVINFNKNINSLNFNNTIDNKKLTLCSSPTLDNKIFND